MCVMFHVVKRDENEFLHVIDCLDNHYWSNLVSNIFFSFFFLQNDWSQQGFVIEYMLPYLRIRKKNRNEQSELYRKGGKDTPLRELDKMRYDDITVWKYKNFSVNGFYVKPQIVPIGNWNWK